MKTVSWIFFFLCLLTLVNGHCLASEMKRFGLGGRILYYDIAPGTLGDVDTSYKSTAAGEIHALYHITSSLCLELSAQYAETETTVEYDDKNGRIGVIEQYPILLTGNFRLPVGKSPVSILLGAGVGYFINQFKNDEKNDTAEFFAVNTKVEMENSLGLVFNLGAEYRFSANMAFLFNIFCVFQNAEIELQTTGFDPENKKTSLNTSMFGLGMRYYF